MRTLLPAVILAALLWPAPRPAWSRPLPLVPPAAENAPGPVPDVAKARSARAVGDTIYLLGGPDRGDGKFQDDLIPVLPDYEGWQPEYLFEGSSWHLDTFNAATLDPLQTDNHAYWCGDDFPLCAGQSENPGYGNDWNEILNWSGSVADPGTATSVHLVARLNHDSEPGYDYLYLELATPAGWTSLAVFDDRNVVAGVFVPVDVDVTASVQPGEYTGDLADEVQLRWRFHSDGGYSNEDCFYQSRGAAQIDNIRVSFDQGAGPVLQTHDDCEDPHLVSWVPAATGCTFGAVWPQLADAGLLRSNRTPQLAFIDNGTSCDSPGTSGVTWTYGPDGYVAYCAGTVSDRRDFFVSPVIELPANAAEFDGALLEFDVYRHGQGSVADPLYTWYLRSSSDGGQTRGSWQNHGFYYEQGDRPFYTRGSYYADPYLPPGADRVQVKLGVAYLPHASPFCDGYTPAPYFDNVALKIFRRGSPELYVTTNNNILFNLLQDAFPSLGRVDHQNLAANSVALLNPYGDPVQVQAAPRAGASLTGPPRLYWTLLANPLFDACRTVAPPNPVSGDSVGTAHPTDPRQGVKYAFTFPDSGFFFPGDELHYYFEVRDDRPDGSGVARLPADTTGFSVFAGDVGYAFGEFPREFAVHALPGLTGAAPGEQPKVLVWQDYAAGGADGKWYHALANAGYLPGFDYDLLQNTNPIAEIVTSGAQLEGYDTILYDCGATVAGNLYRVESDALKVWIAQGGKNLLAMGDNLAADMGRFGDPSFLRSYLGAEFGSALTTGDVRPHIGNQATPLVLPIVGSPVYLTTPFLVNSKRAYNDFDAVVTYDTGQWILEYAGPDGSPGGYAYAAGIHNYRPAEDSHFILLPYGLDVIETPEAKVGAPLPARARLLQEILNFFRDPGGYWSSEVPGTAHLSVTHYPNPFNPRLTIAYEMPRSGDLQVDVFDVQGRLVRTLWRGNVAAGLGRLVWDGTDQKDRPVGAGVYFHRVKALAETRVGKMTLVK